jgi:hypothetical protein
MKSLEMIKKMTSFLILATGIIFTASAQEDPLRISGELLIDNRFRTQDATWSWNENRLDLKLEKRFAGKAKLFGEVWLRSFGFPVINHSEQLFNKDLTSPYNIDIREAYVELYGFLAKNLDVKIGRQRIAWGTGWKLNPTDNVNAYDLEDIWDFGRHLGSDAIRLNYYMGDFYLEGDYVLFFRPASLPMGDWSSVLMPPVELPQGFRLQNFSDSLVMPGWNLGESGSYAFKIGGYLPGIDFSASYLYGRDGFPIASNNRVTPGDSLGQVNIQSTMYYPRLHIVGLDASGSIGSVGIWAEIAMFLPENEVIATNDLSSFGLPPTDTTLLEKKPYLKFVAGSDYTFRNGHYVNFQYLHGFIHERGTENLDDYFMFTYDKSLFNNKLKIRPATVAFVVSDWKDIEGNYALVYMPFLEYMPNLNTTISLGVRFIWGEGEGAFALMKDKDEAVVMVSFKF